ncbi:MAG TPA: hypothetical protein VMA09_23280 [Candidatus Binataceae bacterium]|nr:hypothetical protein [Candidatus Binataceae bacterium]
MISLRGICRIAIRGGLLTALALIFFARTAAAHVGSPNVFYEGDAGPYHLFVAVAVPQVIPGVAQINVRARDNDVNSISTSVARLSGAGSQYAPVPDVAKRSPLDPHQFAANLWLMEFGSLRVIVKVDGAHGPAELSVPVPSFAQRSLPMPRWLGALLLALTIGLAIGAISIVGAAARDSLLTPGAEVSPEARRRGRRAMAFTAVVVGLIFWGAFEWWSVDASDYAAIAGFFKPPKLEVKLVGTNQLELQPSPADENWNKAVGFNRLVTDHGHLMHLFLLRTPAFDRILHLHPDLKDGKFVESLPSLDAGHYEVFADVVSNNGFPWTLVGSIDLPQITAKPANPDDSGGSAAPISTASDSTIDVLADGTRVTWKRDASLRANTATIFEFDVRDPNGQPASDLGLYMGMAAHAEIIKDDLSVFAHIHPSGSVPMASLMMVNASADSSQPSMDMPMNMPGMDMSNMSAKVSPEFSIPYGFPKPGRYRIFLQFKRAGQIETASFTADVH